MEFKFSINNDRFMPEECISGVSGNVNTYICSFDIKCDYTGLTWFCVFKQGDTVYQQIIQNGACIIPYEVLENKGIIYVGCYATNADEADLKRISTNWVSLFVNEGAYSEGTVPDVPTADAWEVYVNSKVEPLLKEIEISENQRQTAENNRLSAENNRKTAESNRQTAEDGRATAESERATAETQRLNSEANRNSNETERILAETARVEAESARTEAESQRALSESERQSAEAERALTESARVEAETARVSAESARAEAEAARAEELAKKADKATTLEGYGIIDAYTKTEVDDKDNAIKSDIEALKQKSVPHTTASDYPLTVTDHLEGEEVINYQVYGNSVQDGTPTPDTPVEIQSVGDLVTDETSEYYGKYDVSVRVCGKNLLPNSDWMSGAHENGFHEYVTHEYITEYTQNSISFNLAAWKGVSSPRFRKYSVKIIVFKINQTALNSDSYANFYITIQGYDDNNNKIGNKVIYDSAIADKKYVFDFSTIASYDFYAKSTQFSFCILARKNAVSHLMVYDIAYYADTDTTEYEPYSGKTKHIYLNEPLRKVGDYADYIDFKNQKVMRQIEVLDDTGTKSINESLGVVSPPTEETITVPTLIVPQSGTMNISATTSIKPSNINLTYYQDINKVITNLTNAILAQGGNV